MLLCSAGVLVMTFWVVRLRFDRPTAVLTVCMLGVNETFYRYGYQVLTDMPFLLGLMLLLLGSELLHRRGSRVWPGAALVALAVLVMAVFRSVVLTVLVAAVLGGVFRVIRGPGWVRYVGVTFVGLCALIAMRLAIGGEVLMRDEVRVLGLLTDSSWADNLHRVFMENGLVLLTEHLPEAVFAVDFGRFVGLPLGLILVWIGLALFRVRPLWGALVVVFLVQWLFFVTTKRYVLVLLPLLAIGWWRIGLWAEGRVSPAVARWMVLGLLALWFGPNLVRVGCFIRGQRSRPFLAQYEDGQYAALKLVADELVSIAEPGDVILADPAPQLTYYTGLPVFGPATLPTFGPKRAQSVQRMRNAKRILLVGPVQDKLNERIRQLKLRQVRVLRIVPTPMYDRQVGYKILQMRMRSIDWERYRLRKQSHLSPGRPGNSVSGRGAAQQGDRQPDEQAGESEQPDDQTR